MIWCSLKKTYLAIMTAVQHELEVLLKTTVQLIPIMHTIIGKGKAAHNTPMGARGERRHSSYSFTTLALDGGERSASRPGRALPPGKGPLVPTGYDTGWAPELVWTQEVRGKSLSTLLYEP
jgi:hypothetical protein